MVVHQPASPTKQRTKDGLRPARARGLGNSGAGALACKRTTDSPCRRIQCLAWADQPVSTDDRQLWRQKGCARAWPTQGLRLLMADHDPAEPVPPPPPLADGIRCDEEGGGGCLPAFLGISCVHCGSTSLASYLNAHPLLR